MYTVAGDGNQGAALDGDVATSSSINHPQGIFMESSGTYLYFADQDNHRVRKVNVLTGITTVFAGDTSSTDNGDGYQASSAGFKNLFGVVASGVTGIFFLSDADTNSNKIRKVATDGIITTYAGAGAMSTTSTDANGDGGAATGATFKNIHYCALDSSENLYINDYGSQKIRKVDASSQIVTTFAGTGSSSSSGTGGFATSAGLGYPWGIFVDLDGKVYFSAALINPIKVIGTDNIVAVFAGAEYPLKCLL